MKRKKPLKAAESAAASAADSGQAILDEAVQRLTPLVEHAGDYVEGARKRGAEFASDTYDRVQPALDHARKRSSEFASDAYERLEPALKDAYDRVEPTFKSAGAYAAETYERLEPTLKHARQRSAKFAADTLDKVHPALDDALDKVTPAVDSAVNRVRPVVDETLQRVAPGVDLARELVQNEFLPWLAAALYKAADLVKVEEIVAPPPKRRSVGKTIGLIALAGAVLAGVAYAIRRLLAPQESGWETHEPSRPYVADPVADVVKKAKDKAADVADDVKDAAADLKGKATDAVNDATQAGAHAVDAVSTKADDVQESVGDAVDDVKESAGDAVDDVKEAASDSGEDLNQAAEKAKESAEKAAKDAKGDASPLAEGPYGEGSYVGAEPPEDFIIKGNERSMKYHLLGTGGYERTITDVWFSSTEAAERAGFVRAQR